MEYERREIKSKIVRAYKNGKRISVKKPIQANNGDVIKLTTQVTVPLEEV